MLFTWEDVVIWFGMTLFEMWINILSFIVFLALLSLRLDGLVEYSWRTIFTPLFIADALNAYFISIVIIRMHIDGINPFLRGVWSLTSLSLFFALKLMVYKKLSGNTMLEYSEVVSPMFIFLQLIAVRTRQLCRSSSASIER